MALAVAEHFNGKRPFPFHIFMPTPTAVLTQPLVIPHKLNQPAVFHVYNFG
jgi:hypothetical protein